MESREAKLTEAESTMMIAMAWRGGEWEDVGQSVQAFSYKMSKFWAFNVQHGD